MCVSFDKAPFQPVDTLVAIPQSERRVPQTIMGQAQYVGTTISRRLLRVRA